MITLLTHLGHETITQPELVALFGDFAAPFAVGDELMTNHGHKCRVIGIDVTSHGPGKVWWSASNYVLQIDGSGILQMDFIDAHKTLGGCLRRPA
jgi:hypothetical protein